MVADREPPALRARRARRARRPGGVYCHVCGCDLVRDGDGRWRVLEDNVRTPSGISYVLENRVAMTRLVPELFAGHRVRAVDHYPPLLLDALRAVAPAAESEPTVVLWTPGADELRLLRARLPGAADGRRAGRGRGPRRARRRLYMRTTAGLQRVHTIYRRLDDDFIDPLEFRPDSLLGVPGLVRAYRAGTVAIANAIGTGVADDKAIYYYVPEMIRFYLGEEPILENVPTYLLADEAQRETSSARLRRAGRSSRPASPAARACSSARTPRGRARGAGATDPRAARDAGSPRSSCTSRRCRPRSATGALAPRHVDLRPFAVFGEEIRIVPGGLTRVALRRGLDDRQLLARRRLQGHLGARGRARRRRRCAERGPCRRTPPPRMPDVRYGGVARASNSNSSSSRSELGTP